MIEIKLIEQRVFNGLVFPLVLGAPSDNVGSAEYIAANRDAILEKLVQHGAVLFRGFAINSPADFNEFALSFGWKSLPYTGGVVSRTHVVGVVYTANDGPPDIPIAFHHEMSYLPKSPSNIMFYCDMPPASGGETPICLSNLAYEAMLKEFPEFVEQLKQKGVKYTVITPDGDDKSLVNGRGWQSRFSTNDRDEAEKVIREQIGGEVTWLPNGSLKHTIVLPGVRFDERVGYYTWYNGIVVSYYAIKAGSLIVQTLGDDTPIPKDMIERCHQILVENSVAFKWEKGDVMVIDNRLAMHSRNSFEPPRRILAALFE